MSATVALNSASFLGIDRGLRLHGGQSLRTQASPAFTESATVAGEGCAGPKRNPPCVFRHGRVAVPGHPRWHSHPFLSLPNPTKTRPLRLLHPYKAPSWHESARNAVPACVCGGCQVGQTRPSAECVSAKDIHKLLNKHSLLKFVIHSHVPSHVRAVRK